MDFSNRNLSSKTLISLSEIFKQKNWEIITDDDYNVFDIFCDRINILSEKEQDLIIDISKRFEIIKSQEYNHHILSLINKEEVRNDPNIIDTDFFYIMPLKSEDSLCATKSSDFVFYFWEGYPNKKLGFYKDKTINFYKKYNDVAIAGLVNGLKKNRKLILIDDYIGAGETVINTVKYLNNQGISYNKIIIFSLAAQEQGIKEIEKLGISVHSNIVYKKGITDFYSGAELKKNIDLMLEIEKRFGVDEINSFGRGQCEALIKLNRTPNNTFPFYWYEPKEMPKAPFVRE